MPKYQVLHCPNAIHTHSPPLFAQATVQQEAEQEKVCIGIKQNGVQGHECDGYNTTNSPIELKRSVNSFF